MDIEKQVVSLDLAKKLKEAGYPQGDSLCYWEQPLDPRLNWRVCHVNHHEIITDVHIAAPTVAELGEKLPYTFRRTENREGGIEYDGIYWYSGRCEKKEDGRFYCTDDDQYCYGETEGDARAKMWLYLKEKELLE